MKIFETPPLPPFGTAIITTKFASLHSASSATTTPDFGSVLSSMLRVALDAVKRSARDKIKINNMGKYKILTRKNGSFQGSSGEQVEYWWYKAVRLADDMTVEFGSRDGGHEEGQEVTLTLEKFERPGGRIGYKEIN